MISVIIPVYNCEKYIEKCVDSVLNGTYQDFEILLINDGSTDNSLETIKKLEKKDFRIKVYDENHAGVSATRNKGIRYAGGEYIAFIDGDDYVEKEYLDELIKPMINDEVDWVYCSYNNIREKNNKIEKRECFDDSKIYKGKNINSIIDAVFKNGFFINLYSNCMCLYRKKIIEDNDLFNDESLIYGEDVYFNYNYAHHISGFAYVHKYLYNYIDHGKSSSISFINKVNYDEIVKLIKAIEDKREKYNEKQSIAMSYYYIDLFRRPLMYNLFTSNPKEKDEKIEKLKASMNDQTLNKVFNNMSVKDIITKAVSTSHGINYALNYYVLKYKLFNLGYMAWRFKHQTIKSDYDDYI